MITTHVKHRYYRYAQLFFAGMMAAVLLSLFYPFVLRRYGSMVDLSPVKAGNLLWIVESPVILLFFGLGALFFCYFVIINRLNKKLQDLQRLGVGILIWLLVSLVLLIRLLLYPLFSFVGLQSIFGLVGALFNYTDGWRPEGAIFVFHLIAWFIVLQSNRDTLDFVTMRRYFFGGLILTLIATYLLVLRHPLFNQVGLTLFSLFLLSGLLGLAMARLEEKITLGSHSLGRSRPRSLFTQMGLLLLALGLLGFAATRLFSQVVAKQIILSFIPLGRWLSTYIFTPLIQLLIPVLEFIFKILERIIAYLFTLLPNDFLSGPSGDQSGVPEPELVDMGELLAEYAGIRYAVVLIVLSIIGLILFGTIRRILLRQLANEAEEEDTAYGSANGSLFQDGLDRLRQLYNRLRGLAPKPLLAIETIENMYANLCRMAARRGYERGVDQPPDRYLPQLQIVFPHSEAGLQMITKAYMRAHYGEQQFTSAEMEALQQAYNGIIQSLATDEESTEEESPSAEQNRD